MAEIAGALALMFIAGILSIANIIIAKKGVDKDSVNAISESVKGLAKDTKDTVKEMSDKIENRVTTCTERIGNLATSVELLKDKVGQHEKRLNGLEEREREYIMGSSEFHEVDSHE